MTREGDDWWRELDFERRQRVNEKGSSFIGWHIFELFAIPPRERDVFDECVKDSWKLYKGARALGMPTPPIFSYLTNNVKTGTNAECDLMNNMSEVEFDLLSLGAFLWSVRYGPVARFAYPFMVSGCEGCGLLLRVLLDVIKSWYAMDILLLILDLEVDPILAFVAIACVTEAN